MNVNGGVPLSVLAAQGMMPLPQKNAPPPPNHGMGMSSGMAAGMANTGTPLWMDVSTAQPPQTRKGATSTPRSGLHTILFFAAITIVVGGVGMLSIAVWGPEKTVANRSHLASNPPPPQVMPSLPDEPPTDPAAVASTAPTDPAPADSSSKKGKKRAPKVVGKKR